MAEVEKLEYVIVKYDYDSHEDQELTVRKGDRLLLIDDTKNWWKVRTEHNQTGFVPSNYVRKEKLVDKAKGTIRALTNPNGRQRSNEFATEDAPAVFSAAPDNRPIFSTQQNNVSENRTLPNPRILGMTIRATVKYSYDPQLEDELRLNKGDTIIVVDKSSDGWWKGEVNGTSGWFPSNYVEEIVESRNNINGGGHATENYRPSNGNNDSNFIPSLPTSPSSRSTVLETVIALYTFDATSAEELSFRKGEKLEIIDHPAHDPDWWTARNNRGQTGLVPRNYIQIENGQSETNAWYFGRISREEADRLLMAGTEGEFIVRDSESNPGDWSISMRGVERNKHFKVQNVDGQLRIGSRSFPDMNALIKHYTTNPIFSSGTEKLYLTTPLRK